MPSIFDDISKGIKDGVSFIVEKTDELTQWGKLGVDLLNLKREIESRQIKLAVRIVQLYKEQPATPTAQDSEALQIIKELDELQEQYARKRSEKEQLKEKNFHQDTEKS
jgi:hypothetical protein